MPATGTWRYVVNSFRFAIRRTVRIAFRAFFVVQGRAEGGVSTGIYPERRSRFTEWPVVCEESRRSPDLCAQRSDAFVPYRRFSRYVRAYSMHNGRRADLRGENRDRKEIGSETRKEWKRKGGLRGRHVWMDEHAAIYDRRIADRVAFKIDPVFQRLANAKSLRTMCVFPSLGASSWRIRGCLRVLCDAPKLCYFQQEICRVCIICWFMRAAHVTDPRRLSACIWVTATSYESRNVNWYIND